SRGFKKFMQAGDLDQVLNPRTGINELQVNAAVLRGGPDADKRANANAVDLCNFAEIHPDRFAFRNESSNCGGEKSARFDNYFARAMHEGHRRLFLSFQLQYGGCIRSHSKPPLCINSTPVVRADGVPPRFIPGLCYHLGSHASFQGVLMRKTVIS